MKRFSNALGITIITAPLVLTTAMLFTSFAKRNPKFKHVDNSFFTIVETNDEDGLWEEVAGSVIFGSISETISIGLTIGIGILPLESTREEKEAIESRKIRQKKLESTGKW